MIAVKVTVQFLPHLGHPTKLIIGAMHRLYNWVGLLIAFIPWPYEYHHLILGEQLTSAWQS